MAKKAKCANPHTKHVKQVPADYDGAYELYPGYFKRGDDFAGFLEEAKGDIQKALQAWGDSLIEYGNGLKELAAAASGLKLDVQASDTHVASILGKDKKAREALYKLASGEGRLREIGVLTFEDYNECEGGNGWEFTGYDEEEEGK